MLWRIETTVKRYNSFSCLLIQPHVINRNLSFISLIFNQFLFTPFPVAITALPSGAIVGLILTYHCPFILLYSPCKIMNYLACFLGSLFSYQIYTSCLFALTPILFERERERERERETGGGGGESERENEREGEREREGGREGERERGREGGREGEGERSKLNLSHDCSQ